MIESWIIRRAQNEDMPAQMRDERRLGAVIQMGNLQKYKARKQKAVSALYG